MERAKAINILGEYCGKRDILAEAIQNEVAKKYIIVGGAGHTMFFSSFLPNVQ